MRHLRKEMRRVEKRLVAVGSESYATAKREWVITPADGGSQGSGNRDEGVENRNPWAEKVGCEVRVCQAKYCDPIRKSGCSLRKYYLERLRWLTALLTGMRQGKRRQEVLQMIEELTGTRYQG